LFISYFDGLRAANLAADLDYIARTLQFDGIRVLPNWQKRSDRLCAVESGDGLFDAAGRIRGDTVPASGPLKRLVDLVVAAGSRGLIVDVTFTRETVPGLSEDDYVSAVSRAATLLRPYRHLIFDLQNEIDKNTLSEAATARLRRAIASADQSRIVVASRGGGASEVIGYNGRVGTSAIAYHDPRATDWAEQSAAVVAPLIASGKPVYLQEPQAWNSGLDVCGKIEGKTLDADGNVAHFRRAVEKARAAGAAAWTFHTRQGFRLHDGTLRARIQANPAEKALLEGTASTPPLSASGR
jgi:regulator of extracellular matrix RemA (YlzA/DUF370 family)